MYETYFKNTIKLCITTNTTPDTITTTTPDTTTNTTPDTTTTITPDSTTNTTPDTTTNTIPDTATNTPPDTTTITTHDTTTTITHDTTTTTTNTNNFAIQRQEYLVTVRALLNRKFLPVHFQALNVFTAKNSDYYTKKIVFYLKTLQIILEIFS